MPSENTEHRKLAAIMFTDMVGYSALSQRNESLALELLAENQRMLRVQFPLFNGREVKTTGDGFLVEFPSALQATQCAVEIQRAVVARNSTQPADRQILVRIGIHVGDVVHREADMYGDGVNIAARIEPLAVGGGICLSDSVYAQVRNKLDLPLTKLNSPELKNIEVPMDVYRVTLPWQQPSFKPGGSHNFPPKKNNTPMVAGLAAFLILAIAGALWFVRGNRKVAEVPVAPTTSNPPLALMAAAKVADPKSIAVLPFANMSEDKQNAFFADGIHEDLLTMLALVKDLHVVSRTSVSQYRDTTKSMRQIAQELGVVYVLEGSVRRAGNKVRVTGQLIRAATDEHVWAKSYDRDLSDIFAIQSELSREIANALSAVISPEEKSLIEHRPTENLAAYDLYLKARAYFDTGGNAISRADSQLALEGAVKLDPNFAAAWGLLARANCEAVFGDEDHSPQRLTDAKMQIETAVRLAPNDPEVIERQGDYYYYGFRDYARAAEQYQRLLVLRPGSADAYAQLGYMLRRQAHWKEALENLRLACKLDPRNVSVAFGLCDLLLSLHMYDEGIQQAEVLAKLANGDLLLNSFKYSAMYMAHGSLPLAEIDEYLAKYQVAAPNDKRVYFLKGGVARARGNWAEAVKIDEEHPYSDPFTPHWQQDVQSVIDLIGNNDMAGAKDKAAKLAAQFKSILEKQPENSQMWGCLGFLQAILGEKESALKSANKSVSLLPESADAALGPANAMARAMVLAWTGDKEGALAEFARLVHTPYGIHVNISRNDPSWLPIKDDPRFEALLKDPANLAPLIQNPLN